MKAIVPVSATLLYDQIHPGGTLTELGPAFAAAQLEPSTFPATNPASPGWAEQVARTVCATEHSVQFSELDGTFDAYWAERHYPLHAERIGVPVLTTGSLMSTQNFGVGDNDRFFPMWAALERADVPRKGYLGPWPHGYPTGLSWSFLELRFFEQHLRGNDTGMMDEPPLTLIDQEGVARTSETTVPGDTLVLHAGDGALAPSVPSGSSVYRDVPARQQQIMRQAEGTRLIFTSDPISLPIRISGTPLLEIVASIDTTDTNFAAYLYDVASDGAPRSITRGWLDARHRRALDRPGEDVVPGVDERYMVELWGTEWTVHPGHRLQIILTSSDSCIFGTECAWLFLDGIVSDTTAATVTVREGDGLTRLILPVVE